MSEIREVVKVPRAELARIIRTYNGGRIFSARFIKKTTGEIRTMVCRKSVTKYLSGGELKYDPISRGLISVFDVQSMGYRMISESGLISTRIDGFVYELDE